MNGQVKGENQKHKIIPVPDPEPELLIKHIKHHFSIHTKYYTELSTWSCMKAKSHKIGLFIISCFLEKHWLNRGMWQHILIIRLSTC